MNNAVRIGSFGRGPAEQTACGPVLPETLKCLQAAEFVIREACGSFERSNVL